MHSPQPGALYLAFFARSGAFRLIRIIHAAPRIFIFTVDQSFTTTGPASPKAYARKLLHLNHDGAKATQAMKFLHSSYARQCPRVLIVPVNRST